MKGYYFLYIEYKNGRKSIRDRPYLTYEAAQRARLRRLKKPGVQAIEICYQVGIADPSAIIAIP